MSDHFQVGDVVSCIDHEGSAAFGTVARVMHLSFGYSGWDGAPVIGLHLNIPHPDPRAYGWDSRFWRKLPRADDEFIQQIRACKPHRSKVPA